MVPVSLMCIYKHSQWHTINLYIAESEGHAIHASTSCKLMNIVSVVCDLLLFESPHDSRQMLGTGSSSGVELFQVFVDTGLWQDGADQQVFHYLYIPTFARCLSIFVESPFLRTGFASSSPCPEAI